MTYQLIVTEECNLGCLYCFEEHKKGRTLSKTIADIIIRKISEQKNLGEAKINYNGGEPVIALDMIKYMHPQFQKMGISDYSLSTNLTLPTYETIDYLYDRQINLHISIDGDAEVHDSNRRFLSGAGTFSSVIRNIEYIRSKYPDWICSYSLVFTSRTLSKLHDSIAFLLSLGIVNVTACFSGGIWDENCEKVFSEQLRMISVLFIEKYTNGEKVYISLLNKAINYIARGKKATCGAGRSEIAILPNGDIIPCTGFVGTKEIEKFVIGNIMDFEAKDSNFCFETLFDYSLLNNKECVECDFITVCHNTCFAVNERLSGNIYITPYAFCSINKQCLIEAEYTITELVENGNTLFFDSCLSRYLDCTYDEFKN